MKAFLMLNINFTVVSWISPFKIVKLVSLFFSYKHIISENPR